MIARLKRLLRRRRPGPSAYPKTLAVHIAATTRSAGRSVWS